jgi:hypothetical protein
MTRAQQRALDAAASWYLKCGTDIITSIQKLQRVESLFAERNISNRGSDLHMDEIRDEIRRVQRLLDGIMERL